MKSQKKNPSRHVRFRNKLQQKFSFRLLQGDEKIQKNVRFRTMCHERSQCDITRDSSSHHLPVNADNHLFNGNGNTGLFHSLFNNADEPRTAGNHHCGNRQ